MTKTRNMLSRAAAVLTKLHSRGFFDLKVDFVELNLQSVAKRTAVLLCVLTMTAQTAWADDTYTFSGGSGTQSDPYLISTPGDIQHLATSVNSGTTGITWDGVYFEQTNDIDYGSYKAWPIGRDSNHRFGGHYNGRSFAIRNYKYSNVDERYKCCGLFGYVCGASNGRGGYEPCSLENIVLENCNIDSRELSETGYTAGICAYAYAATISNCRVTGTIQGPSYTGGITAHYSNYSTIKNCFADVTVVTTSNSQTNKGKIIGYTPIGLSNVTGNYYYDNGDGVPGCGGTYVSYTDSQIAAVRSVTIPNGLNVSPAPAVTYAGIKYFIPGTTITLSTGSDNTIIVSPTVSGAQSYTIDDHSITLTVGTNDVTVSGRVVTVRGSCGTNATWQLADTDGNGTYETLTISGSGTMQNYSYTTVDGLWRTNAPWGWQELTTVIVSDGITSIGDYAFIGAQNVKSVTIGNSVTTIGRGAINHCDQLTTVTLPASVTSIGVGAFENCQTLTTIYINHDGAVSLPGSNANAFNAPHLMYIIFPGTAGVLANTATTGNWAPYKDKLRAKLGSQHFGVTTEGGTAIYTIATEADLRNLATLVNQDGQYCSGLTFRQTADITLNGTFTPVGNYTKNGTKYSWFEGTYDGGNHTISGLSVSNSGFYSGLFGKINGATVKNVVLVNPTVTNYNSDGFYIYVGALVGSMLEHSKVENCHAINPTVTAPNASNKDLGAIVGLLNNGAVTNCCYYSSTTYYNVVDANYANPINNSGRARKVTKGTGIASISPAATVSANGFVYNNETYYREGVELTLSPAATVSEGYHVVCSANGTAIEGNTYTVNSTDGDVTLTAVIAPITYTVSFNANGGTGETMANQGFTYDEEQQLTANSYTRTNYIFAGWNTKANGSGNSYADQQSVSNLTTANGTTVILYAQWVFIHPWTGTGTSDDPYIIEYPVQLDLLAYRVNGTHGETRVTDGYYGKYFRLGADITYSHETDWNDANSTESNYEPIGGNGGNGGRFRGDFDGNNKTVSGIRIYGGGYKGLFGSTGPGANIYDLTLADARITSSGSWTGGIVGYKRAGTITRCHVLSTVAIHAVGDYVGDFGGIVGYNTYDGDMVGTVSHCTSAATITIANGVTGCRDFGAIAGENYNSILTDNLAIGATVPATYDNSHGAIVGNDWFNGGTLERNYYVNCTVAGVENATGVGCGKICADIAENDGALRLCTLTLNDGLTTDTETNYTYGDTGYYKTGTTITLHGLPDDAPAGYSAASIVGGYANGANTFVITGDATVGINTGNYGHIDWAAVSTGDEDDPYIIYDAEQLNLLARRVNGSHGETVNRYTGKFFKLAADITYSHETDWNDATSTENNYEAIGNNYSRRFCGDFDGNNKTVSGIRSFYYNDNVYQGLFGYTNPGANIHDLTLADARITSHGGTGGIVGTNASGTITRCHVLSTVAIHAVGDYVGDFGGIVGHNGAADYTSFGTVSHCTSAATLTIADGAAECENYGVIAGFNSSRGILTDNLATGATVPAAFNNSHGAIVGRNYDGGTLERNYYVNCTVAGVENATGVGCGYMDDGHGGHTTADITENDGAMPLSVIPGDANSDGHVTLADAIAIVNYILGKPSPSINAAAADVNHDNAVTISDAVTVLNMATSE